jgi:pyruvyltransferase
MTSQKPQNAAPLPLADGQTVPVYRWVPNRPNESNFGDDLGPMVVRALLERRGKRHLQVIDAPTAGRSKLLSVGSIIHNARQNDVIWGSGINGKVLPARVTGRMGIVVTAVRGPLTREILAAQGVACPEVYGDPGLLFPVLYAAEIAQAVDKRRSAGPPGGVIYIPNLNDERLISTAHLGLTSGIRIVSPGQAPCDVAAEIAVADLVLTTSLHGVVLAEALGVPVRLIASLFEPAFKYLDYFMGTGRSSAVFPTSVAQALRSPDLTAPNFDIDALMNAFPQDMLDIA